MMSSRSKTVIVLMLAAYLVVMFATNGVFTILDDESGIVNSAAHPVIPTIKIFILGPGQHEHPPFSDVLLHAWLMATGFSFRWLRVFANLFYAASILLIALSAREIGGRRSFWITFVLGLVWPFAFQYGRITGWYCVFLFFVSLGTWIHLRLVRSRNNNALWFAFALTALFAVWTNYFAVVVLLIFFVDLLLFHRRFAAQNAGRLAACGIAVAIGFLPLVPIALLSVPSSPEPVPIRNLVAVVGYPIFALFGSAAVAPWYWPFSVPIALGAILVVVAVCFSAGRRWLLYSFVLAILLTLTGHINIKYVLFLLGRLFPAFGLAASSSCARVSRCAVTGLVVLVIFGWAGIFSGRHYATTNLLEPWPQVASTVANHMRWSNAAVVSDNEPFFFYLNYDLGLQASSEWAPDVSFSPQVYAARGYKVFAVNKSSLPSDLLRGNVILVTGSGSNSDIEAMSNLNIRAQQQCRVTQTFKAAPDPGYWVQKGSHSLSGRAVLSREHDRLSMSGLNSFGGNRRHHRRAPCACRQGSLERLVAGDDGSK